jgi:hypothetical protein
MGEPEGAAKTGASVERSTSPSPSMVPGSAFNTVMTA